MGKDVRGIERGKCACGECEDFMRSDGATRGYCGCLPTRLFKKDARYSSDAVDGTSGAGTSESASPEEWKDEDLRRLPNPKANILNSQIIFCQNSTCPFGPLVPTRNAFSAVSWQKERKRQWEVREALKAINHAGAWVIFQAWTIGEPSLWERRALYGV